MRGTTAVTTAAQSALVRTRLHGAVREPVDGEAGTGEAGRVVEPSRGDAHSRRSRPGRARRAPRRARRDPPSRGAYGGRATDAVDDDDDGVIPVTVVSAASRRPSEARNERSEWRREGYPPEGPRPRSGLGRVARSRSDAPRLIVRFTALSSIIRTIGDIGVRTIGSIVVIVRSSITVADMPTTITISIGAVTVSR